MKKTIMIAMGLLLGSTTMYGANPKVASSIKVVPDDNVAFKSDQKVLQEIKYLDKCEYPVSGIVQFMQDGKVISTVDYGNGACDSKVKITEKGKTKTVDLAKMDQGFGDQDVFDEKNYKTVIKKPVKTIKGCQFPVSGLVETHYKGKLISTIDYGNGKCDNKATVTEEIELEPTNKVANTKVK